MNQLRKIIVNVLLEAEKIRIPEWDKPVIVTFPEVAGIYVKALFENSKKQVLAYSFFYPGEEKLGVRMGILFLPDMELRYATEEHMDSKEGWESIKVPELKLSNGKPDLLNVARKLFLMKQKPLSETDDTEWGVTISV